MNARLHPLLASALLPMAPPSSIVHRIVSEEAMVQADQHNNQLKASGELERRRFVEAERIQREFQSFTGVAF